MKTKDDAMAKVEKAVAGLSGVEKWFVLAAVDASIQQGDLFGEHLDKISKCAPATWKEKILGLAGDVYYVGVLSGLEVGKNAKENECCVDKIIAALKALGPKSIQEYQPKEADPSRN